MRFRVLMLSSGAHLTVCVKNIFKSSVLGSNGWRTILSLCLFGWNRVIKIGIDRTHVRGTILSQIGYNKIFFQRIFKLIFLLLCTRVHCHEVGHTIVGDFTYSNRRDLLPHRWAPHFFF